MSNYISFKPKQIKHLNNHQLKLLKRPTLRLIVMCNNTIKRNKSLGVIDKKEIKLRDDNLKLLKYINKKLTL